MFWLAQPCVGLRDAIAAKKRKETQKRIKNSARGCAQVRKGGRSVLIAGKFDRAERRQMRRRFRNQDGREGHCCGVLPDGHRHPRSVVSRFWAELYMVHGRQVPPFGRRLPITDLIYSIWSRRARGILAGTGPFVFRKQVRDGPGNRRLVDPSWAEKVWL